jgi:hypothetical protein
MSRISDENLRGIPMKPYDLIREGLIILGIIAVIIILLAIFWPPPDYPTVRGEDVATYQPIAYVNTAANILAGNASLQDYGPPYNSDTTNSQRFLGIAPITWFGVRLPIDPRKDFVLTPLARVAIMNKDVADALGTWKVASDKDQATWIKEYIAALEKATVINGNVQVTPGEYGPVPVMMQGMMSTPALPIPWTCWVINGVSPTRLGITRGRGGYGHMRSGIRSPVSIPTLTPI